MQAIAEAHALDPWRVSQEPFYRPLGGEVRAFAAAAEARLPVLLTDTTGCGKTRFVEHMAWRLGRPLVTLACHEDLSAGDLAGRWLLEAEGTRWQDGPLALAARHGAICYLDELVEAAATRWCWCIRWPTAAACCRWSTGASCCTRTRIFCWWPATTRATADCTRASSRRRGSGSPRCPSTIPCRKPRRRSSRRREALSRCWRAGWWRWPAARAGCSATDWKRALRRACWCMPQLAGAGLPLRAACLQAIAAPLTDDPELAAVLSDLVHAAFE